MSVVIERNKTIPAAPARLPGAKYINMLKLARDPFAFMQNLQRKYGDIAVSNTAPLNFTFVFSPEYTRQVLTDTTLFHNGEADKLAFAFDKDSAFGRLTKTLNAINGDKHKQQRRLMMPAFHRKRVETYRDEMVEITERKLAEWHAGQVLDIMQEMKQLTMAVAVKTLLGLDPLKEGDHTRRLVENWIRAGASPLALLLPAKIPGTPLYKSAKLAEGIESQFKAMIERKRAEGASGNDVLSSLIQARDEDGGKLSDAELVSQTLALFVAGHETTATALTWTLFLLSQHPRMMSDLLDELEGTLHNNTPTVEQINHLPMLDNVIKESMRVLSPFLWGFRITTAPTTLGDYDLAEGTIVAFAPAVIQHDPAVYPDPKRFDPYRWHNIDPSPYEYLPFSSGSRMCIGATFAIVEMKLVLAIMLQRFRLTVVRDTKIERAGLLLTQPKNGLTMEVHPQDRHFVKNNVRGNLKAVVKLD